MIKCTKHPKYRAIRKPNCDCLKCWQIWGNKFTKLKIVLKPILKGSIKMPPFEIPNTDFFDKLNLEKPELAYHYGFQTALLECREIIAKFYND